MGVCCELLGLAQHACLSPLPKARASGTKSVILVPTPASAHPCAALPHFLRDLQKLCLGPRANLLGPCPLLRMTLVALDGGRWPMAPACTNGVL